MVFQSFAKELENQHCSVTDQNQEVGGHFVLAAFYFKQYC